MAAQISGQVGTQLIQDGTTGVPFRQGKTGELITSMLHGSYYEPTARGKVYSGMTAVAGTTIVAGNNSPVAAGAASVITLYNPLQSGVNLEVLKCFLSAISGTSGAGSFVFNIAYNQTITATPNNGGATSYPVSNNAGGQNGVGRIFTQTALTGSGAQVLLRPLTSYFAGALAATTPQLNVVDLVDGEIVLPPGAILSVASPATGSTFIVVAGLTWNEVAISS